MNTSDPLSAEPPATPRASERDQRLKLIAAVVLAFVGIGALINSVHRVHEIHEANRPFALLPARDQDDATDFTLKTADGSSFTLTQALKRGPVVLDYWATWCGPCRQEMPKLEAVSKAYQARGVQVYGVNIDATPVKIRQYAQKYGLTFPQIVGVNSGVDEMFQVEGYPTTIVIDTHGKIRARNKGDEPDLEANLSETLDVLLQK